jgi:hypothetical protein
MHMGMMDRGFTVTAKAGNSELMNCSLIWLRAHPCLWT